MDTDIDIDVDTETAINKVNDADTGMDTEIQRLVDGTGTKGKSYVRHNVGPPYHLMSNIGGSDIRLRSNIVKDIGLTAHLCQSPL